MEVVATMDQLKDVIMTGDNRNDRVLLFQVKTETEAATTVVQMINPFELINPEVAKITSLSQVAETFRRIWKERFDKMTDFDEYPFALVFQFLTPAEARDIVEEIRIAREKETNNGKGKGGAELSKGASKGKGYGSTGK